MKHHIIDNLKKIKSFDDFDTFCSDFNKNYLQNEDDFWNYYFAKRLCQSLKENFSYYSIYERTVRKPKLHETYLLTCYLKPNGQEPLAGVEIINSEDKLFLFMTFNGFGKMANIKDIDGTKYKQITRLNKRV